MCTINDFIKVKKIKIFNCLTLFCSLVILAIAFGGCSFQEEKQEKSEQNVSAQNLNKATIPIEGMSCNACVASIKKKLKSLDGLEEVNVSLEQRNATVFYEEGSMTAQQIQEAINELGYKAGEPVTKDKKQ